VVDHRRDHPLEAQKHAELNGDEHDREDDPDDRRDQPNPVMKQIAGREGEDQRRRARQNLEIGLEIVGNGRNVMALSEPPVSM
jgi:hypothetical protein